MRAAALGRPDIATAEPAATAASTAVKKLLHARHQDPMRAPGTMPRASALTERLAREKAERRSRGAGKAAAAAKEEKALRVDA
jgi:hypothetical protein